MNGRLSGESHPAVAATDWLDAAQVDGGIVVERHGRCTVIRMYGEHDISNVSYLRAVIDRADDSSCDDLVFDLGGVTFMSAATVGAIRSASAHGHRPSRSVSLRDPSRCARRMLDLCGLLGVTEGTRLPLESSQALVAAP